MSALFDGGKLRLGLLSLVMALGACSGQSADQSIAKGRAHLEKKEYRAAQIEFKNALQKDSSLNEARFLLGQTLLETGDSAGALVEFNKLHEAGFDINRLGPKLATALLSQAQLGKLVSEWSDKKLSDPKQQAELQAVVAMAYGLQGKQELARESAEASLKNDASNLSARLVVAQVKALRSNVPAALEDVAQAEREHPDSARVKVFKAQLMQLGNASPAAAIAEQYRAALKLDPQETQAHVGLIQLSLQEKNLDAASQQLEALRKVQSDTVLTQYYTGLLALERKDFRGAKEAVDTLLRVAPDNVAGLQLAGRIAFEAGSYAQAVVHLGKALSRTSQPAPVRLLLARAQLRLGDNKKALSTLQPLLAERGTPIEAYTLAADAQVRLGDADAAKKLYQRALELNPVDERARSALAVFDLGDGRVDQGLTALKGIVTNASSPQTDALLASSYLRANRLDEAKAAIEQFEKKYPGQVGGAYLRGQLALAQGDVPKAAAQFEEASRRDAKDFAPVMALATLDQQKGNADAAVARLQGFVEKNPRSMSGELALIGMKQSQGAAAAQTVAALEPLIKKYPDAEQPRVALVQALIAAGDVRRAQTVANDASAALPDSPALLEVAGLAELAAGNHNQALQAFTQEASLRPKDAGPMIRLAQVHLAKKDVPTAITQLWKAVSLEPGNLDAQYQLVTLLARIDRRDQAMVQARAVQGVAPANPLGWVLEGDLRAGRAERAAAVSAYRTALSKARVGATAVKLHRALEDAGQLKEAKVLEDKWRAEHPQDPVFNYYMGDRYLVLGEMETAAKLYRSVLAVVPKDPASLNNLAWILGREGKPEAIEFGERAVALAPKSPSALDTLAELYQRAGRQDRAIALQRQAVEYAPDQPMMRLRLAQYLVKGGQSPAARKELETLSGLGSKFPKQDEVKRLMSQL